MMASALVGGNINGFIRDAQTRQPLVAVNVMIDGSDMGTMSDETGWYSLNNLPSGSWVVRFSMMGYSELTKTNVEVRSDGHTGLDVLLEPSVLKMNSVTVTAPAFQKSSGAVVSERSIDLGELRADPGAQQDLQRSVQVLPSVSSGSDQMNEIIVRGGAPGENLFLIDDIEIPNPNHFGVPGTGGGPVNLINAEFVSDINFYAGAFPARYGDKTSSVMDIRFREGSRDKRQFTTDMGMAGIGGTAEGPIADGRGSYLVTAHKSYLDLMTKSVGLSAVPRYWNTQGKVVRQLNPANKLSVNAVYGADAIEITAEENDAWSRGAQYVKTDGYLYAVGTSLLTNWNKSSYSRITAYRNETYYAYDVDEYIGDKQRRSFADQKITLGETALKALASHAFSPASDIQAGFEFKRTGGRTTLWSVPDTMFLYTPGTETIIDTLQSWSGNDMKDDSYYTKFHSFASFTFHPLPALKVIAGLRMNRYSENSETTWAPRLGMAWSLTPALTLNLGAGRHFQTPYFLQSLENRMDTAPVLKSKYTDQIVAGMEYFPTEKIRITVEVFDKQYHDYPMPLSWTMMVKDTARIGDNYWVNAGKARSRGLELFMQKKMFDTWYGIVSLSLSKSEAWDERYAQWYPWDYDYRHIFNLVGGKRFVNPGNWSLPMRILSLNSDIFTISARYRMMGGRPYTKPVYDAGLRRWTVDETHRNTERYPSYSRFDLALQWKSAIGKHKNTYLVSYFNIENLFNTANVWDYIYNPDGSIDTVLQYAMFPVGGFILEF